MNKNLKISTLQRKIKDVKDKIKQRMRAKKDITEDFESKRNTSDFVWVGGFHERNTDPKTPEPSSKRKLSYSSEDDAGESDDDIEDILSPATIELQMAWYKNFHIRFFEDEVKIRSPAKRLCHPAAVGDRRSATMSSSTPVNFSAQIKNFRDFFEVPEVPDFKIYDDYHYPASPLARDLDYRNLVAGHTPAPPLPPRNVARPPLPPRVFRTVRRSLSYEDLNNSYLL